MIFSRETTIRRDAEGRWYQDGVPVEHPKIAAAFDRWLELGPDGRFRLANEANWAYVEVDGAPLFVRAARLDPLGAELSLSDGGRERLDPSSLRLGEDGHLYCSARGGRLSARFDSSSTESRPGDGSDRTPMRDGRRFAAI